MEEEQSWFYDSTQDSGTEWLEVVFIQNRKVGHKLMWLPEQMRMNMMNCWEKCKFLRLAFGRRGWRQCPAWHCHTVTGSTLIEHRPHLPHCTTGKLPPKKYVARCSSETERLVCVSKYFLVSPSTKSCFPTKPIRNLTPESVLSAVHCVEFHLFPVCRYIYYRSPDIYCRC